MGKKHKSMDAGTAYIQELGFRAEKSRNFAYDKLRSVTDKTSANNLINILMDKCERKNNYSQTELYIAKNASLELSLKLSSTYRADIYCKICNWIVNHKNLFGSCILDLGCDCGIMTCFLARQFPQSHIIGIDIIPNAIENAKQLAVQLNVNNVEFICVDAFSFNKPVDTVFSMLTMLELLNDNDFDETCRFKSFNDIAKYWTFGFNKIFSHISDILSSDGHIISIDSNCFFPFNTPAYLSLIYSMYYHNLYMKSFDLVSAKELDFFHNMQCLVAIHDNTLKLNSFDDTLIFKKYVNNIIRHNFNLNKSEYYEFDAKLMRDICCGELMRGFYCKFFSNEYCEFSVWRDKLNPQSFIFFRTEGVEKFTRLKSKDLANVYKKIDFVYKKRTYEIGCIFDWEKMD